MKMKVDEDLNDIIQESRVEDSLSLLRMLALLTQEIRKMNNNLELIDESIGGI